MTATDDEIGDERAEAWIADALWGFSPHERQRIAKMIAPKVVPLIAARTREQIAQEIEDNWPGWEGVIRKDEALRLVRRARAAALTEGPRCTCVIPGTGLDVGEVDPACPLHGALTEEEAP